MKTFTTEDGSDLTGSGSSDYFHRRPCEKINPLNYLKLNVVGILLYLDTLGVLPAGLQQKVFNLLDFPRHFLL